MLISMIVAVGRGRQIGADNSMLWHISDEFKHFKKTTMGHTLLMGRKSFESIGKPLPGRTTIIITRDKSYQQDNCHVVHSLEEGIELARSLGEDELFITGGGQIYELGLPYTQKLYISTVDYDGDADIYFPKYSHYDWDISYDGNWVESSTAWKLQILEKAPEKTP